MTSQADKIASRRGGIRVRVDRNELVVGIIAPRDGAGRETYASDLTVRLPVTDALAFRDAVVLACARLEQQEAA
jgi:hypothetical protein